MKTYVHLYCKPLLFLIFAFSTSTFAFDRDRQRVKSVDDWSSREKKDFKNRFAYCTDPTWTSPVNLSYQFPRSSGLGDFSPSTASSALLSAALNREDPKNFLNRSRKLLRDRNGDVLRDDKNLPVVEHKLLEKGRIDDDYSMTDDILRSGLHDDAINRVWNRIAPSLKAWGCEDLAETSTIVEFVESEDTRAALSTMLCKKGGCRVVGPSSLASKQKMIETLVKKCDELSEQGKSINKYDLFAILYKQKAEEIQAEGDESRKSTEEYSKNELVSKLKSTFDQHDVMMTRYRGPAHFYAKEGCESNKVKNGKKLNKDMMRVIKSYLCSEVPLLASFKPEYVPGIERSEDSGYNYKNVEAEYANVPTMQHFVLTGMYTSGRTRKAYLEFRSAHKEGNAKTPDSSLIRIPVSEVCHLKNVKAIVTPEDEKRAKVAGVKLHTSKYSTAYMLDYRSKKYSPAPSFPKGREGSSGFSGGNH